MVTVTTPGCLKTRKSTTGMVLMRDAHCLKVLSHTQSTISLGSGESKYYGIVKSAAIGLGARSMLADFGMCADVVVRTDSSSGLAVGSRRGLGGIRHVQTRYLWVQQRVQEGDLRLKKEPGDTNVTDALTKPLDEKRMMNLLTMMGYEFRGGAHIVGAGSAVTNWRLKSSLSPEENCKLFSANDDQNCFEQHGISARIFWKHAELHSCILERDGRAWPLGWQ